jgi:hypothetical protein
MGVFAKSIRTLSRSACDVMQARVLLPIAPFHWNFFDSPVHPTQQGLTNESEFIAQFFYEEAA